MITQPTVNELPPCLVSKTTATVGTNMWSLLPFWPTGTFRSLIRLTWDNNIANCKLTKHYLNMVKTTNRIFDTLRGTLFERKFHTLALPTWLTAFTANLYVSPLAVLKPRWARNHTSSLMLHSNHAQVHLGEWLCRCVSRMGHNIWHISIIIPAFDMEFTPHFPNKPSSSTSMMSRMPFAMSIWVGAHGSHTENGTLLLATKAVFGQGLSTWYMQIHGQV